jgi:protein-tyrosine phosphatase
MSYARQFDDDEVPDPYYGLAHDFDLVLDMIEDAAEGLLDSIVRERGEPEPVKTSAKAGVAKSNAS